METKRKNKNWVWLNTASKVLQRLSFCTACLLVSMAQTSCVKEFLPDEQDAFDKDAAFSTTLYKPTLGRTTVFTDNFNAGNSTIPLTFSILDVRHADGTPAPELTTNYPVKAWVKPYLGTEKSLEEIEAKRTTEYRPLLQIRKHSGEIVMESEANSSFVKVSPDEGYVFDVRAENSGGYKEYAGLKLQPIRESDYEPTTIDENTGFVTDDYVHPTTLTNMFKEGQSGYMGMLRADDVKVYFRRNYDDDDPAPTLTFRFLSKDFQPISPAKFNRTDWKNLIHGFNMKMTDEYVKYQVAYPIPLITLPTKYTDKTGEKEHVAFSFDRIYRNNTRLTATMSFDFAIYKEADWEIIFVFEGGNPDFTDNI